MSFFKQVLAVIVGLFTFQIIGLVIFFIFISIIVASFSNVSEEVVNNNVQVKENSVLWLDLAYDIPERNKMENFNFGDFSEFPSENLGLQKLIKTIEYAKTDDNIEGLYLDLTAFFNGYATADAVRKALLDFKESGKFIMAYGEVISQKAYYVASVADYIYINPSGIIELRGIGTRLTFFNKLLEEKLDAEIQVFKVGTFKSAVEPFTREDISDSNREQLEFLLSDIKDDFLRNISIARNVPESKFDAILNDLLVQSAEDAVEYNLADGAWYYDEVLSKLAELTESEEIDEIESIRIEDYASTLGDLNGSGSYKIGVLYATGSIVDGEGERDNIGGENFAKEIRKIRNDEDIDALVLRVNSGGGSALASEVMWRELDLLKKEKPFIVSMGDIAASGGYYIACHADRIFAEENTITGSIGVFGLIPNMQAFFNDKLGITFDDVKLNDHATFDGFTKGFDDYESMVIQNSVERIYETFTNRVAEGRDLSVEKVKEHAEGRVWTGQQAKDIGLVDELGGLDMALAFAAEEIVAEDFKVIEFPKMKNPFEIMIEDLTGKSAQYLLEKSLGKQYKHFEFLEELQLFEEQPIQTKMPYILEIN